MEHFASWKQTADDTFIDSISYTARLVLQSKAGQDIPTSAYLAFIEMDPRNRFTQEEAKQ